MIQLAKSLHVRYFIYLVVLALPGCVSQPDWAWEKAGATQNDFHADAGQCRAQAFSVPGGQAGQVALVYVSCLEGKGWYRVAAAKTSPEAEAPAYVVDDAGNVMATKKSRGGR